MQPNAEITTIAFVVKIMPPQTLVSILHYRTIPPVIKQTREKKILPKYAFFLKKPLSSSTNKEAEVFNLVLDRSILQIGMI